MRIAITLIILFLSQATQAQITTSVLSPGGNAKFDTARIFKRDSAITYITPTSLALKLNISDTTGKWVTGAYRKAGTDSVFVIKAGAGVYAFKDSTSSAGTIYYQTLKRNGIGYTQQPTIDFSTQFSLNDNIANSATDVSISALAQSVITGLTDSLNSRVRNNDTSSMLSTYLRKADTSSLSTRINLKANIASPAFTGVVTIPTPFTLGATSVTSTGTQLNYLNAATGTTGTTSTNLVYSEAPALTSTVTITNTADITLGSESALRVGGAANSTNITMGEYNSALGIQARNNGTSANLFLQGDGGGVAIGNGALTGQRILAVNNTGTGTGDYASFEVRNGAAGTEAIRLYMMGANWIPSGIFQPDYGVLATGTGISGMAIGTQANVPLETWTNNTKRWVLDGSGNTIITGKFTSSGGGLGYSTGAGGTVTQLTSRTTGVTLNELCGNITMFSAAQAANAIITFTLTNSFIEATDYLLVQHISATNGGAWVFSTVCAAGSATITITNSSNASITSATPLRFFLLKAVTN
jgi:hypothetical protein